MAKKIKIPGVSFSLNRALGITSAKRKVAKATGIPTTKAGRQRKAGKILTGGGCLIPVMSFVSVVTAIITLVVILL